MGGFVTGVLTLIILGRLVQTKTADQISGLFSLPAKLTQSFLDPSIPALRAKGDTTGAASSATDSAVQTTTTTPSTTTSTTVNV